MAFFDNRFFDITEFVPKAALPQLGVPPDVAAASGFGAAINSGSYRSKGVEFEAESHLGHALILKGSYDYLDAIVTRSFSSSALQPAFNPLLPNIPIGAYGPLVGNRPFRRAPHSGYFGIYYGHSRWALAVTGTLIGKRDDSDFLSDKDGGTTLLLPNRNLDASYRCVDASASYRVSRFLSLFSNFQNVLSQHYQEAFGYPALPFTFRSGIKIALRGESWKLN